MLLHPGTLSRHDPRLVAVAQQFPRRDNELPLGATHGEATDNVEDPHSHLGTLSVAHPTRMPHLESEQQPQLVFRQAVACPETSQQASDELSVKEALSGDQSGLDIPVDQYPHIPP